MKLPIGIDPGTTNSVASVVRGGKVEVIPIEGSNLLPSAVSLRPDGVILIGKAALAGVARNNSIPSAMRWLGDEKAHWMSGGQRFTPEGVSAILLGRLKVAAEAYLQQAVSEAVITVPACFHEKQRQGLLQAARMAGLTVLRLLPGPTAAAVYWGIRKGMNQTILVYDLGGGALNVSLVRVKGNRFRVLAAGGSFRPAGDDFDTALAGYLAERLTARVPISRRAEAQLARECLAEGDAVRRELPPEVRAAVLALRELAERAKCELSRSDTAAIYRAELLGVEFEERVTLVQYNQLIAPLVAETIRIVHNVLRAARLSAEDVGRVILVGGSTRNQLVRTEIGNAIRQPRVLDRMEEIAACGAAESAAAIRSRDFPEEDALEIADVVPFSLGVCSSREDAPAECLNSVLIERNTPMPCTSRRTYHVRTRRDGPNRLEVVMLQGESPQPGECLAVGRYVFSGIPHLPGRPGVVEVEYGCDGNGMICVQARTPGAEAPLAQSVEPMPDDFPRETAGLRAKPTAGGDRPMPQNRLPYSAHAGRQRIPGATPETPLDRFGNPLECDLCGDQAFRGYALGVLQLSSGEECDFAAPTRALEEKGFQVRRWTVPPSPAELDAALDEISQLWVISTGAPVLSASHLDLIERFFETGAGLSVWGGSDPANGDANRILQRIFGVNLSGNHSGEQVVSFRSSGAGAGFGSHPVTTGLQNLDEGSKLASLPADAALSTGGGHLTRPSPLQPLIYGSDGSLLAALCDAQGRRALIDGGSSRLFSRWDTAGTARYVKNVAAWLVNCERFGFHPASSDEEKPGGPT